jgi:hypothetical protein
LSQNLNIFIIEFIILKSIKFIKLFEWMAKLLEKKFFTEKIMNNEGIRNFNQGKFCAHKILCITRMISSLKQSSFIMSDTFVTIRSIQKS